MATGVPRLAAVARTTPVRGAMVLAHKDAEQATLVTNARKPAV